MAARTSDLGVASYESVSGRVRSVIETHTVRPSESGVALLAFCGESSRHMIHELRRGVVGRVAGNTLRRTRSKRSTHIVWMAALTRQLLVRSTQRETRARVQIEPIHQSEESGIVA